MSASRSGTSSSILPTSVFMYSSMYSNVAPSGPVALTRMRAPVLQRGEFGLQGHA